MEKVTDFNSHDPISLLVSSHGHGSGIVTENENRGRGSRNTNPIPPPFMNLLDTLAWGENDVENSVEEKLCTEWLASNDYSLSKRFDFFFFYQRQD